MRERTAKIIQSKYGKAHTATTIIQDLTETKENEIRQINFQKIRRRKMDIVINSPNVSIWRDQQ